MTRSVADMIQVGDVVIVPSQGPCHLLSIEEKTQYGCADTYYTFRACGDNQAGTVTIPAGQLDKRGVRLPASPELMLQALARLRTRQRTFKGNVNRREAHFRDQLCSPNPIELAECIRDLWTPEGTEYSGLSLELYEKALARLAREVAIVFQEPYQGVRGKIESLIDTKNDRSPAELFGYSKKP